ncbi:MAG: TraR/DksA C4-type zinc finger protein [Chloroflexota bacterium]
MEHATDLELVRQKLAAHRATLLQNIADEQERLGRARTANPDRADLADAYISRERRSAFLARNEEHLELVEAAIKRLEEGQYGLCTRCGEPIQAERLEVLPEAPLCMECQRKAETPR